MKLISPTKWQTFTSAQKHRYWINIFLEIEKEMRNEDKDGRYPRNDRSYTVETPFGASNPAHTASTQNNSGITTSEISSILTTGYWTLDTTETDERLRLIYDFSQTTHSLPEWYHFLRGIYNEELMLQKDFHFLPTIKSPHCSSESHLSGIYNSTYKGERFFAPTIDGSSIKDIILILDNLRSAFNVGSIIRTAECLSISQVCVCGYTPTPDHPKVKNTAMGCENVIKWQHFTETAKAIAKVKESGYTTFALETHLDAQSIYETIYPDKSAILVGNEALGINNDILSLCDKIINIPITGWKTSLNVATATAIALFEIFRTH